MSIMGPEAMPKVLHDNEYKEYLAAYTRLGHESLFNLAYGKKTKDGSYALTIPKVEADGKQLWDDYVAINMAKWSGYATVLIVAGYIYAHRVNCGRKGDDVDDYIKAEYLVNLVKYLNQKHARLILLRQDDEMEVIISEVNNIFDSAYFRKLNHPELTEAECFLDAEREYCEDKEIDYLADRLQDHKAAESLHKQQEIGALAYQHYEWRKTTGEPGDDKGDWAIAVERYPKWKMTKRIATICWYHAADKHQHQDYYWSQACAIIDTLDDSIDYVNAEPYEPRIHDVILARIGPIIPDK
jgi:hypothetical protein